MAKIPPEALRQFKIEEEIREQPDRGAALIAVAFLDEKLKDALRSRFVQDSYEQVVKADRYFLGNLYGNINMAYCLGLFGPKTYQDLRLIRGIRNDFAHKVEDMSFKNPIIVKPCQKLFLPTHIRKHPDAPFPSEPRDVFLRAVYLIMTLVPTEAMFKTRDGETPSPARSLP